SRRRHTRSKRDWSSDVCSSDLVDSSVAAELILFFNPEISMSGYSSSTFNSASREMACGLFSSTKSEALGQAGSIDYSGIDWFASVIDPDNVDSRIAADRKSTRLNSSHVSISYA